MAPGLDGTVFALVPRPGAGQVLARFDRAGRSSPGWPIAIKDANVCRLLLPVEDGTIRLLCDVMDSTDSSSVRAFAFDAQGRSMAGWPVAPGPSAWDAGRVVRDDLALYGTSPGPGHLVMIIASDGSIRRGAALPEDGAWAFSGGQIGPDGTAYSVHDGTGQAEGAPEVSRITGVDLSGVRAGWPVKIDGIASEPAFGSGGRIVLTVGSRARTTSRVAVLDGNGNVVARSATLPIQTAVSGVDCVPWTPRTPLTAADGSVFVWSDLDTRIFALDASLKVKPGWPYRPATWLVAPGHDDPRYELNCSRPTAPGVGPDGTLYLPLQPRGESVGGTLVAVDPDGRDHPGWPVTLRRPGAEFQNVVVGSDGTLFALAVEPEAGDSASATILAIDPDSTVRYRTTIIAP